jgi:polyphosphate kinase
LLHFPYHSFDHFIDLLREASIDPKVTSIKITLYRLARNSSVVNALQNATKNGKSVTAVVELQARFDEEANIQWANKLREEGVKVIFGAQDLKVHSKLCLITRKEQKKLINYVCIGTGNFNEDTTDVFSDHLLLTSDKKLSNEIIKLFYFFERNYTLGTFRHMLLAPFYMRNRIEKLIENEIKNAKEGKEAYIQFKLNNLTDESIIRKLYEADKAGVKIKLIVRGMYSLKPAPQINTKSNIEAISIVDKFLEHSRIFIFCNNGQELFFISSADLMPRNLDRRIEVTCPIYDKSIQKELKTFIDIQWLDNVKARILNNTQSNRYRKTNSKKSVRSQVEIYNYLKSLDLQANPT